MGKKKLVIGGLASVLVVAMVVAVVVGVSKRNDGGVSSSNKAVDAICSPTDYKETCQRSLSKANTTDPRQLVKLALVYTVDNVGGVIKNSTLLREAAKDKSTKDALDICEEVLGRAVEDLKRSFEKVDKLDASQVGEAIEDLKTWLSAVLTYEETCIDAFENTTGDTGEKMKNLLKTTKELSSNGLAMATDIQSVISTLQVGNKVSTGRRLLTDERRQLFAARPNAVVAQDGSGQFKSIQAAIDSVPKKNDRPFVIKVKAGLYKEYVEIPKKKNKIVLIGEGPLKTRITGNKNYADGVKTYQSATVAVNADDFMAKNIAFENTAGPEGHQAVALRVSGDRAIFHSVHIDGNQDSLYTHTYRQFYRWCRISGTIDFVFGDALAIFQKCEFVVRKPMEDQACMVTAQGRLDQRSQGAIVIQNGHITATKAFLDTKPPIEAYLGRPWKKLSRTIIMQSNIDGFIAPQGWSEWSGNFALDTLYYAEYKNRGPGSKQDRRVKWKGIRHMSPQEAQGWTPGKAYKGDMWVRNSGVPYDPSWMKV